MERPRHWITRVADRVEQRVLRDKGEGATIVCASGVSPSGPIHLGNLREVMTVHLVAEELRDRGWSVDHVHSWDDFDRLRKLPAGVPAEFAGAHRAADLRHPRPRRPGGVLGRVPHRGLRAQRRPARHRAPLGAPVPGLSRRDLPGAHRARHGPARADLRRAGAVPGPGPARGAARGAPPRVLPLPGLLRELPQGHHGDRELGPGHGRALVPLRQLWPRRGVQPARQGRGEAGLEGRLADALDLRARRLRARGGGPLLAGQQLRRRPADRARGLRRRAPRPCTPSSGSRAAPRSPSRRAPRHPRRGPRHHGAADRPLALHAARPNQCFTIDFGQEVVRLYDEWDAFRQRAAAGTASPADAYVHERCVRTSAGEVTHTADRLLPPALVGGGPDAGARDQILRIVAEHIGVEGRGCRRRWRSGWSRASPAPSAGSQDYFPEDERTRVEPARRAAWEALGEEERRGVELLRAGLADSWSLAGLTRLVYGVPKVLRGQPMDAPADAGSRRRSAASSPRSTACWWGATRGRGCPRSSCRWGGSGSRSFWAAPRCRARRRDREDRGEDGREDGMADLLTDLDDLKREALAQLSGPAAGRSSRRGTATCWDARAGSPTSCAGSANCRRRTAPAPGSR